MECPQASFSSQPGFDCRAMGGSKRRIRRRIHIGSDEETLEARAIEVTSGNIGDALVLPELLNQIPPDQVIGGVTADGAYDTRECHARMSRGDSCSKGPGGNPTSQKRQTMEAHERRCHGAQRSGQCAAIPGPRPVATMERIPPPKPRRNQDALHETVLSH